MTNALTAILACISPPRIVLVANQSVVPVTTIAVVHDGHEVDQGGPLLPGEIAHVEAPAGAGLLLSGTPVTLGNGSVGVFLAPWAKNWVVAPLASATIPSTTLPWGSELSERFSTGGIAPERIRRLRFYAAQSGALPPQEVLGPVQKEIADPMSIARFIRGLGTAHEGLGAAHGPAMRTGMVVGELEAGMIAWFRFAEGPGWLKVETPPLVNEPGTHARTVASLDPAAWP